MYVEEVNSHICCETYYTNVTTVVFIYINKESGCTMCSVCACCVRVCVLSYYYAINLSFDICCIYIHYLYLMHTLPAWIILFQTGLKRCGQLSQNSDMIVDRLDASEGQGIGPRLRLRLSVHAHVVLGAGGPHEAAASGGGQHGGLQLGLQRRRRLHPHLVARAADEVFVRDGHLRLATRQVHVGVVPPVDVVVQSLLSRRKQTGRQKK
jgi:hypothetical protein